MSGAAVVDALEETVRALLREALRVQLASARIHLSADGSAPSDAEVFSTAAEQIDAHFGDVMFEAVARQS